MPAVAISITVANINHVSALNELSITTFCDAFGPDNSQEDMDKYVAEEMSIPKLTDELKDGNNIFFIAWMKDEMAGYAKMRLHKKPEELSANNPIEIERIYVLQKYHGQKIGTALMSHCINHALASKHDVLWLGVWEHNHHAIAFYNKWGFEIFGTHPFVLGNDHQTDLLMKKQL